MKRNFAKVSEISAGDIIEVDGGFTCIAEDSKIIVHSDNEGLYFICNQGQHWLGGQLDDGDVLIGIYKTE